jgi:hypothetical protein
LLRGSSGPVDDGSGVSGGSCDGSGEGAVDGSADGGVEGSIDGCVEGSGDGGFDGAGGIDGGGFDGAGWFWAAHVEPLAKPSAGDLATRAPVCGP